MARAQRALPLFALLVGAFMPATSLACGGFFCNAQTPIDQSSEDILFTFDEESGTVRAVVRIRYEGQPADFSWILPLTGVPEIRVGGDVVFEALRSTTDLSFNVTTSRHNCGPTETMEFAASSDGPMNAPPEAGFVEPNVSVVEIGQTGPYDYVVLSASDASELREWLEDNEYDVPDGAGPLLEHYAAQGMVFVAVKLQATAEVGDIAPIVLELEESEPCVPLVLTAVAAQSDMPIRIWVAANGRAIPSNWFAVEPNWTRLNWQNPAVDTEFGLLSYDTLVSRAVDEAEGRGFVTEFAWQSIPTLNVVQTARAREIAVATATTLRDLIAELDQLPGARTPTGQLSPWLVGALSSLFDVPAHLEVTATEYFSNAWLYEVHYRFSQYDSEAVISTMADRVFEPLRDASEWLTEYPDLTRIYTRISPHEMTRDPMFTTKADYTVVLPQHSAELISDCGGGSMPEMTYVRLEDGTQFIIPFFDFEPEFLAAEPYSRAVTVESPHSSFLVRPNDVAFVDNQFNTVSGAQVTEGLKAAKPYEPQVFHELSVDDDEASASEEDSEGGCRAVESSPGFSPWMLLLLGLGWVRSSRRRRTHAR